MIFIGIDPGNSGAAAVIDERMSIIGLFDWPGDEVQAAGLLRSMRLMKTSHAAIEKVHAMPKQGVVSVFKFGTNYGIWKGILAAMEIPFHEVTPRAWQKGVISKARDKKPSIAAAMRLFPSAELVGPRGGTKDGRADALLIAYWLLRQLSPESSSPASPVRPNR